MNKPEIKVDVSIEGIDEATKKAERYVEVLKEAKTLAGELASIELTLMANENNQFEEKKKFCPLFFRHIFSKDNFLVFILGIVVGCTLVQLGIDLWKLLII
ncbi:hypothetical protein [Enterococcus faecalis]|uniref:hypothetical protein n=1 Tax=Enterococcus faecalis TaxID=1351 RepID=UPI003D3284EE